MKFAAVLILALSLFLFACSTPDPQKPSAEPTAESSQVNPTEPHLEPGLITAGVSFKEDIQPLIAANCLGCHSGPKAKEGIDMSSFKTLITTGEHGPIIKPGSAADSMMVKAMNGDGMDVMPPKGKLSAEDIAKVTAWIEEGADNN